MKHQYVGDINDYRKYALLRALSAGGANRIGVCWMLTPDDGGTDGGKLSYLKQPDRFCHLDPELFDILAHAAGEPDRRRLQTIEDSGTIPNVIYHNDMLPQAVDECAAYMAECRAKFGDADLVFFDPDNGIEALTAKPGRKAALKYVFLDEVAAFYGDVKSALIYQHFPMMKPKQQFVADTLARLRATTPDAAIFTFTTAHVVFFLLVHPESPARLAIAALRFVGSSTRPSCPANISGAPRCSPHSPIVDGDFPACFGFRFLFNDLGDMMTKKLLTCAVLLSALTLAACNTVETQTTLTTPATGQVRTAGPGDTVMSFQSRRALPNAFGQADIFGRTTNAGGTTVRYVGSRGGQAVFERSDVQVTSNATTMSETPLILPTTSRTNIDGTVGRYSVSGTATTTSSQFIPARGSSQYATAQRPIQFSLGSGQSVTIEGRTLRVVRVGAASVEYRVE